MLWGLVLLVAAAALASSSYVEIYVEGGPPLTPGDSVFVFNGVRWVPVDVIYVPEVIPTLIVATGNWVDMRLYREDRYILLVPREAVGRSAPPPPGYTQWILKTEDGKETALAVGPPMREDEQTLGSLYRWAEEPPATRQKGKIEAPPTQTSILPEPAQIPDVRTAPTTVVAAGSIYFRNATVTDTFNVVLEPHIATTVDTVTPMCLNVSLVNWMGYEYIGEFIDVGVVVDGSPVSRGEVIVELYRMLIDGDCVLVARSSAAFEGRGVFARRINLGYVPQHDEHLGIRIIVRGTTAGNATITVNPVVDYRKQVNNASQLGISSTRFEQTSITIQPRTRWVVLIGPFVWSDGVIFTQSAAPILEIRGLKLSFKQGSEPCPPAYVRYYVNGIFVKQSVLTLHRGDRCIYTLDYERLVLEDRFYKRAKYITPSGALSIGVEFVIDSSRLPVEPISISMGPINMTSLTWTEPFHSSFRSRLGRVFTYWAEPRLYAVADMSNRGIDATTGSGAFARAISRLYATRRAVVVSLEANYGINSATWRLSGPLASPWLYYGSTEYQQPWWRSTALAMLGGISIATALIPLPQPATIVTNLGVVLTSKLVDTASATVSYDPGNGILKFRKGWSEQPPRSIYIELIRGDECSPRELCIQWGLRSVSIDTPTASPIYVRGEEKTICLVPRLLEHVERQYGSNHKMWTWRGLTDIGTDFITAAVR